MRRKKPFSLNCQQPFSLALSTSVDECITGLFKEVSMCALSYIFNCFSFSSSLFLSVHNQFRYILFLYSLILFLVPIATYCAQEHYWLFIFVFIFISNRDLGVWFFNTLLHTKNIHKYFQSFFLLFFVWLVYEKQQIESIYSYR